MPLFLEYLKWITFITAGISAIIFIGKNFIHVVEDNPFKKFKENSSL